MNPNQALGSGSAGDPGSHLQFQISLLRLMDQKMTGQETTDLTMGDPVPVPSRPATSNQVMELERMLRPRSARVRLKRPS